MRHGADVSLDGLDREHHAGFQIDPELLELLGRCVGSCGKLRLLGGLVVGVIILLVFLVLCQF